MTGGSGSICPCEHWGVGIGIDNDPPIDRIRDRRHEQEFGFRHSTEADGANSLSGETLVPGHNPISRYLPSQLSETHFSIVVHEVLPDRERPPRFRQSVRTGQGRKIAGDGADLASGKPDAVLEIGTSELEKNNLQGVRVICWGSESGRAEKRNYNCCRKKPVHGASSWSR